ncbi:MAG: ABC transporter permease [Spirochaetes bacterium]|nr:ABC transporter permease [Spirochaetota bacterium]MBU1079435.1 ABC transporter permease [Spirochaetota bacterium]
MTKQQRLFEVVRTGLAILIALVIALVIILVVSDDPGDALYKFLLGPLGSFRHFGNVIELMIPLVFTGIAISIMFSAAQFNLGAEGGFFIGAIATAFVAIKFNLPPVIHPIVAILFGSLVGSLFCGIPAVLKVKWGASELVSSLMFNYIAFFFGLFLINYYLRDASAGAMVSFLFKPTALLPKLVPKTRISVGIFAAVALVAVAALFMQKTRWGFRIRLTGANAKFSQYSGIDTNAVVVYSQVIGGFIAGLGGSIELLGMYTRFSWQNLPGYGWDGVIVAILARNNPLFVPIAAFFLAYLRIGADIMSRYSDVPNEFVALIQGTIIILIAASSFLAKYRHKLVFKEATRAVSAGGDR